MILFSFTVFAQQDNNGYFLVKGLIHMDSEISGGENSLEMLAAAAKNAGGEFAFVTDHDTQRVTYGIWPLKKLIKMTHSRASVIKYGVEDYVRDVHKVNRQTPEFVFLPGIEAVPYYYWETSPMTKELTIRYLHRHLLVLGMEDPEDIKHLPSIEAGYPSVMSPFSFLPLLWIIPLIIAFMMYRLPSSDEYLETKIILRMFYRPQNITAMFIGIVSIIFLINGFPYTEQPVNQYEDAEELPYQILIDYVNDHGGMVFWAHPEARYDRSIVTEEGNPLISALLKTTLEGGIKIKTEPYHYLLNETFDYTGFAIFFEGKHIVGKPEGLWDSLLMQFVSGKRRMPVWAIAELDMEEGTDPETASESQNVFLVKNKTREDYLEALRVGKVYCYCDHFTKWLTIRDFSVISGDARAVSGEVLTHTDDARLVFDVEVRGKPRILEAVVVKDGKVIANQEFSESGQMIFPLTAPEEDMGYVRVAVNLGGAIRVATNPIFFKKAIAE